MKYLPDTLNAGLFMFVMMIVVLLLTSCTSDVPRMTKVNGVTHVQTDKRFLGVKVRTATDVIKTKAQQLDDLEVQKETREQELDLQAEERQSAAAFWIGLALMVLAPVCVIIGYIASGWKFWGTMGALSATLGAAFWSFEHLIPYLKWPAFGLAGCVVLWSMWKLKDFNLIDRLKGSAPGEILGNSDQRSTGTRRGGGGDAGEPPALPGNDTIVTTTSGDTAP